MPLTIDDVLRFLRERTSTDACPSCGTNHWGIDGYGKDGFTYAVPTDAMPNATPQLHRPARALPVVLLVC